MNKDVNDFANAGDFPIDPIRSSVLDFLEQLARAEDPGNDIMEAVEHWVYDSETEPEDIGAYHMYQALLDMVEAVGYNKTKIKWME